MLSPLSLLDLFFYTSVMLALASVAIRIASLVKGKGGGNG